MNRPVLHPYRRFKMYSPALWKQSNSRTAMIPSSSTINTHSYISHVDLEVLSNKVKKLQSDLGGLTSQTWGGPGKDKILDCKHDVDGLAQSLKQMEALNTE